MRIWEKIHRFRDKDKYIGRTIRVVQARDKRYNIGDTFKIWKKDESPWQKGVYFKSDKSDTGIIFLYFNEFEILKEV